VDFRAEFGDGAHPSGLADTFDVRGPWKIDRDNAAVDDTGHQVAFVLPKLYSALKDIEVTARFRITSEQGSAGIKLGDTWKPGLNGLYILVDRSKEAVLLGRDISEQAEPRPFAEVKVTPFPGEIDLHVHYRFEERDLTIELGGKEILKHDLRTTDFQAYMDRFGRPANLNGTGFVARGASVELSRLSIAAGMNRRRIIAFGDSNTHRCFWVEELSRKLSEPITNVGLGGDDSVKALRRIQTDIIALRPEIAIVFIGTNDMGAASPDAVGVNLSTMVGKLKASGIHTVLCTILPRMGNPNIPRYNDVIRQVAQREKTGLFDWHDALNVNHDEKLLPEHAPDGVHPTVAGARAMIQAIDTSILRRSSP